MEGQDAMEETPKVIITKMELNRIFSNFYFPNLCGCEKCISLRNGVPRTDLLTHNDFSLFAYRYYLL